MSALAHAHALTLSTFSDIDKATEQATTLHALIGAITAPYEKAAGVGGARITITGPNMPVSGGMITSLALLLHEFATNAAKYGALSTAVGLIEVTCSEDEGAFCLLWSESGGPPIRHEPTNEGFGSLLARLTVTGQLGGELSRDWRPEGLAIRLSLRRHRIGS